MKFLAAMILCLVCVIPQIEMKGRRSGRRQNSGSRSSGLPRRVSELEALFENQSSWLQALQNQMNALPTLQDYLTLNQTLQGQINGLPTLQDYVSLNQTLQGQINGLPTLQDFLTLNQTLQGQINGLPTQQDILTLNQTLQGQITGLPTQQDFLTLNQTLQGQINGLPTQQDFLTLNQTLQGQINGLPTQQDILTLNQTLQGQINGLPTQQDILTLNQTLQGQINGLPTQQDFLTLNQTIQGQINGLPTQQDYLALNQTLQDQADALQALQDQVTDLESCVCDKPGTLEIHSPVAYTWEIVGDDCMSVPCDNTFITFQVKSCRDAHILLMQDNSTTTDIYKLVIGGWANTRSVIRLQQGGPNQVQLYHNPLSCTEFRPFWASWDSGVIRMGTGLIAGMDEFLSYNDTTPTKVNQVAVATLFVSGDWIINASTCQCQN